MQGCRVNVRGLLALFWATPDKYRCENIITLIKRATVRDEVEEPARKKDLGEKRK
jgi:hypothetical protein